MIILYKIISACVLMAAFVGASWLLGNEELTGKRSRDFIHRVTLGAKMLLKLFGAMILAFSVVIAIITSIIVLFK